MTRPLCRSRAKLGTWPSELADHWLYMALASEHTKFEWMIDEFGYKFADDFKYPELRNNRYRFAVVGKRIGHPSKEGIYWAFPTYAYQSIEACTRIEQQRAAAVVEGGPCQCPMCVKLGASPATATKKAAVKKKAPKKPAANKKKSR